MFDDSISARAGGDTTKAAQEAVGRYRSGLQFQVFRTILQSATYHKQVVEKVAILNSL